MGKAIDLRQYQDDTLDITLLDNSVLRVRKPSQQLIVEMLSLETDLREGDNIQLAGVLKDLLVKALGNNKDGIEVTEEWLTANGLDDFEMMMVVFQLYGEFARSLVDNPNFKSLLSQTSETAETGTTTTS